MSEFRSLDFYKDQQQPITAAPALPVTTFHRMTTLLQKLGKRAATEKYRKVMMHGRKEKIKKRVEEAWQAEKNRADAMSDAGETRFEFEFLVEQNLEVTPADILECLPEEFKGSESGTFARITGPKPWQHFDLTEANKHKNMCKCEISLEYTFERDEEFDKLTEPVTKDGADDHQPENPPQVAQTHFENRRSTRLRI